MAISFGSLGVADKKFISALDPMIDVRAIEHNVYDIWREEDFSDILNLADRKSPVAVPTYHSWVNTQLFAVGDTTGATISGSGTATVTVTFTAGTSGYVRKGDVVLTATGDSASVQSVTLTSGQDVVIIKSVTGANIVVTAGDKLPIYSVAVGEKSDAMQNIRFGYTKYSNKVQIFTETSEVTDIQKASKLEAHINGSDVYVVKDHLDKLSLLKAKINGAFIASDMSATSFSDSNPSLVDQNIVTNGGGGGAIQTTRGLNKYVETYGVALSAVGSGSTGSPVPNGSVSITDFDNVVDSLNAQRADMSQMIVASNSVRTGFDKFIKNLASSGITSSRLVIDGKELDTTVEKFTYGGFDFNFTTLPILRHSNYANNVIGKSAYFLPLNGRAKIYGGDYQPAMGVKYIPSQTMLGSDLIGEMQYGGLAPVTPSGSQSLFGTRWVSTQGFQMLAPSQTLRLKVKA